MARASSTRPVRGTATTTAIDGRLARVAACVLALAALAAPALAQTSVSSSWRLVPEGLDPGDSFRLLFVSSATRNAVPTNIATYNTWIRARAAAGHSAIRTHSSLFKVVGSTAAVDARDNTATTYTNSAKGVPIYWLKGPKVVDDYEDFYDGSWDNESDWTDENGTRRSGGAASRNVWTGSNDDGTKRRVLGESSALGASIAVTFGQLNARFITAMTGGQKSPVTSFALYGLSSVFQVASSPSSSTPAAVSDVVAMPVPRTPDSLAISWSAPDNRGKPALTGLEVRYKSVALDADWTLVRQGADSTSLILNGLVQGGYYDVEVRALNAEYFGPWSSTAEAATSPPSETVLANHPLVPDDLGPGDSFRLLHVTSGTTAATSTGIRGYHDFAVTEVSNIVQPGNLLSLWGSPAPWQRALVSTPGADARLHADTTWTSDDRGVPIYWVNGAKVADDYADFYDGDWDDEANPKNGLGEPRSLAGTAPWTGTDHYGAELFDGAASRAMGQSTVGIGAPGSTANGTGPLNGGAAFASTEERPLYGLWHVMVISENTRLITNIGQAATAGDGTDTRAAVRAQLFTTGPHLAGYGISQIAVVGDSNGDSFLGAVALYTTDADGEPDLEDGLHATLSLLSEGQGRWLLAAPEGTVLKPRTTYALVFQGASGSYPEIKAIVADAEDISAEGWSIADALLYQSANSWLEDPDGRSLEIEIVGPLREDTEGPEPGSATVDATGYTVTLAFDEDVALPSDGAEALTFLASLASAFAVTAGGADVPVSGLTASSADQLTITLSGFIVQGQAVTVTYTDPTDGDDAVALQDALGNETATFTTGKNGVPVVTNGSTAGAGAPGAPTSLSATASGNTQIDLSWTAPGSRWLRHHRLQDRGLLRWRLQLDRPRSQHQQHHHHLLRHRPRRWHHPPLPRLRHQLQRSRHPLQRRRRHHRHRGPRGLEPQAHRPDRWRQVPAAVPLLHQARRLGHRHRGLQHLHPDPRRSRPRRHPGLQRGLQGGRLHRRHRRPRQYRHHLHHDRQGRPHLLARRRQGRRRLRGFLRRVLGR